MRYVCLLIIIIGCHPKPSSVGPIHSDWSMAFASVKEKEARAFSLSNVNNLIIPAGRNSYHQQGIQQLEGGGWAVSGSGEEKGYIYFTDKEGVIHTVYTIPDDLDTPDSEKGRKYNHPGGFQITNNVLAIGVENTDDRKDSYSKIVFLDVSNPKLPKHYSHLDITREVESGKVMTAGAVAITELADSYLVIVGNWDSKRLDFYKSSSKDLADENTQMSQCLGSWIAGDDSKPYQNINVYGDAIGELYLVGMYSKDRQDDWADLFTVDCSDWEDIRLIKSAEKQFSGGSKEAHFVHGSGTTYDAVNHRLLFYATVANRDEGVASCSLW